MSQVLGHTYKIYVNILEALKYRKVNVTTPPLNKEELIEKLLTNEYVLICGLKINHLEKKLEKPRQSIFVLVAPESEYSKKSIEFEKVINIVMKAMPRTASIDPQYDIFVVGADELSNPLVHKIKFLKSEKNLRIVYYPYFRFDENIMTSVHVPLQYQVSENEVTKFLNRFTQEKNDLPKILVTDPVAEWLDLKVGDYICSERISENTGVSMIYRQCIEYNE